MITQIDLPLDTMTIADKMDVVDRIMADLSRNASSVPAIEWHGDVLREREENLRGGSDRFISLEDAEKRIREKTGRK